MKQITKVRLLMVLFTAGSLLLSFIITVLAVSGFSYNTADKVDSSLINGVLTSITLVIGFSVYEIRKIKTNLLERLFLILPIIALLCYSVDNYLATGILYGYSTKMVLLLISFNFLFSCLYFIVIYFGKELYERI